MELKNFSKRFSITAKSSIDEDKSFYKDLPEDLFKLLELYAGVTFENGLYRIHSFRSSMQWSILISDFFVKYKDKIYPFGFDWLGRQFCLSRFSNVLYMFDPSTVEDFAFEQKLLLLHDEDFVTDKEDLFCVNLFSTILSSKNVSSIDYSDCFGHKIPLFLGGKDVIENYERQNLEVYWQFQNQLYNKTRGFPDGTKIGQISIE